MPNALLVVMDGLGDRGKETPLSKAQTPNLDKIIPSSSVGLLYTLGPGQLPGSDTAHLALFGYDPHEYYRGRGPFEALGAGVDLRSGDVSFRANLCTIDDKMIILDRRAGRADYGMNKIYATLDGIKIEDVSIRAIHTVEHRGAVVFCGPGLSAAVTNTDPHETNQPVAQAKAADKSGEKIARIMNGFTQKVHELLKDHPANKERIAKGLKPANMAVLRGAGLFEKVPSLQDRFGLKAICIAGGALYKGVAKFVGMDVIEVPGATGTAATDLAQKANAAIDAAGKYDLIFTHIKGTDSSGHDGNFDGKCKMIEKIDADFFSRVIGKFDTIIITGDHSTPVSAKRHTADPAPILFWNAACRPDGRNKFTEVNCAGGSLGQLTGTQLLHFILDHLEKEHMFGE
ncbi:MAG: 2,3-bisphosphoglycerate-independent phosphoglycerate mutase [Phycisphaerae bacterium]